MYNVSEAYRAAIRAPVRTERLRGELTLTDGTVYAFGPEDLMSGSVTLDNQCVTGQELQFGCVYLGQAAFQLRTDLSRYRLYGARLALTYGLQLPGGTWAEVPLGVYTVAEAERTSLCVSIRAYDNLLALDRDYTGPALQGTPYAMLSQIAAHCGLELGVEESDLAGQPNAAETFQLDTGDGCATWRDCLAAVAQVVGCFGAADRAGALVLRPFAATPCLTLGPGARTGAAVADYVCRYTALTAECGGKRLVSQAAADSGAGGLTMTLTDAPLLTKGLTERNQALLDALCAYLQGIEYVPATLNGVADPALDCGDRLTVTVPDTGGTGAPTEAETLVTHRVWKFRGNSTCQGVGKNPYLAAARDKNTAALQQLQADSANNRLIFYSFTNPAALTVPPGVEVTAAYVTFVTVEKTTALFLAQLLLQAASSTPGTPMTLTVRYYLNGSLVAGYTPAQTLPDGPRILALFYPFNELEADTVNRFEIRLFAADGSALLAAGALRGVVTGRGLADGAAWDGTLQLEDSLGALAWGARTLTLDPVQVQPTLSVVTPPVVCTAADALPALAWGARTLALDPMQDAGPDTQLKEE